MKVLGIILAILNVLVAILVLVFAGKNYDAHRKARYESFRHELALTGLPVDDKEMNLDQPDDPIISKLTPSVLTAVFQGNDGGADLGGAPVQTVLDEFDRVRAKVKANIAAQATVELKRQKL